MGSSHWWVAAGLAACWCGAGSAGADGFPRQPEWTSSTTLLSSGARHSDEFQGNAAVTCASDRRV